jgi:hypothetical protein
MEMRYIKITTVLVVLLFVFQSVEAKDYFKKGRKVFVKAENKGPKGKPLFSKALAYLNISVAEKENDLANYYISKIYLNPQLDYFDPILSLKYMNSVPISDNVWYSINASNYVGSIGILIDYKQEVLLEVKEYVLSARGRNKVEYAIEVCRGTWLEDTLRRKQMRIDYENAMFDNKISGYNAYLFKYPSSVFAKNCIRNRNDLEYANAVYSGDIQQLNKFIAQYPEDVHTDSAKWYRGGLWFDSIKEMPNGLEKAEAFQSFIDIERNSWLLYPAVEARKKLESSDALRTKDLDQLSQFIQRYPNYSAISIYIQKLAKLTYENLIVSLENEQLENSLSIYLTRYPDFDISKQARKKLDSTVWLRYKNQAEFKDDGYLHWQNFIDLYPQSIFIDSAQYFRDNDVFLLANTYNNTEDIDVFLKDFPTMREEFRIKLLNKRKTVHYDQVKSSGVVERMQKFICLYDDDDDKDLRERMKNHLKDMYQISQYCCE